MAKTAVPRVPRRGAKRGNPKKDARIKIRDDRAQVFFADMVNVAIVPPYSTMSFYQTVPDPAVEANKPFVRFANAVVTMPLDVAIKVAELVKTQLLRHTDLSKVPLAVLQTTVSALEGELGPLKAALEEKQR